jgi:predicted AAA+ superfamily ATPase
VIDDLLDRDVPPANITYFDFSDARLTEEILPNAVAEITPSGAVDELPRVLLFDEISRAINWDLWLKNVVDRGGFRVGVTDSAASLLRSGTRESGQGRWIELQIEGLTFDEAVRVVAIEGEPRRDTLRRRPGLFDQYLAVGGYPAYLQVPDHHVVWEELREELVNRAVVRDLLRSGVDVERARNLFVFLVRESGAIFKVGDRARQLDADPRSVHDWLRLLEEAGLIARLPRFATRPSRRMQSDPRFYASDHGLIWALSLMPSRDPAVRAKVFEAVVFRHLREILRSSEGELSYFRPRNDLEIDFVLDLPTRRVAVEVTSSPTIKDSRVERMIKASSEVGAATSCVVYGGHVLTERRGIPALPLVDFLLDPAGSLGLETS